MPTIVLNPQVSMGDVLTAASILVSVFGLLYALSKDRSLRRAAYADKIRSVAGEMPGRLQRWRDLSLRLYEDLDALIVDADSQLVKDLDVTRVRDFFWKGLVIARSVASQRVIDEKLQDLDVALYGYHPTVQVLVDQAVNRMRQIEQESYSALAARTQEDILVSCNGEEIRSAVLGNALRATRSQVQQQCESDMNAVITPLRQQMMRLVAANDNELFHRRVHVPTADEVLPPLVEPALSAVAVHDTYGRSGAVSLVGEGHSTSTESA